MDCIVRARETVFCRPLTFPTKTPGSEKEAETDPHDVFPGRPAAKIMNHRDRSVERIVTVRRVIQ